MIGVTLSKDGGYAVLYEVDGRVVRVWISPRKEPDVPLTLPPLSRP